MLKYLIRTNLGAVQRVADYGYRERYGGWCGADCGTCTKRYALDMNSLTAISPSGYFSLNKRMLVVVVLGALDDTQNADLWRQL